MRKIRMTITITDKYEVSTSFRGTSDELSKCNRALARHLKEQSRAQHIAANAASLADDKTVQATREAGFTVDQTMNATMNATSRDARHQPAKS